MIVAVVSSMLPTAVLAQDIDFEFRDASSVGFAVVDIATGEYIIEENADKVFLPASTLKAVTAASALRMLGGDFVFTTPAYAIGCLADSVFNGDIVIESSGDPTVGSRHFPDSEGFQSDIVDAFAKLGANGGKVRVTVDSDMEDEGPLPGWLIGDVGHAYAAGAYGFNYQDNLYGSTPMDSPANEFKNNLKYKVGEIGFTTTNRLMTLFDCQPDTFLLASYVSPPLSEILRSLMVRSDNMMAEAVLRGLARGASKSKAIAAETRLWHDSDVDVATMTIDDGSGLSRKNKLTPRFMANVLSYMARSPLAADYIGLFPRVGIDGTVKSLLAKSKLKGKLALKSGSLSGVQCYAGYKIDDEGEPTHAVVIFVNDFFCPRAEVKSAIEKFLLDTFEN